MRMHLNTKPGENLIYPDFGIDLEAYQGRPNTKQIGMEMARLMKITLARVTDLYANELNIIPFPISKSAIAFKIDISTLPNHDSAIIYDVRDNRIRSLNYSDTSNIALTEMNITAPPSINNTIP